MKSEFTTFERRMQILSVLMNQRLISCPELARIFRVSDDTITRDIFGFERICTHRKQNREVWRGVHY